jgi:putative oxidoreductase
MRPAFKIASLTGPIQSIFRIIVGFLFACHGVASLFGVLGGAPGTNGGTYAFGTWPGWWASAIELVGGIVVALGVGTRVAALICSGCMAFAYFTVHIEHGLLPLVNAGEPAALYSWIFVLIAAIGPGPWTLAAMLGRPQRGFEADVEKADVEEATA